MDPTIQSIIAATASFFFVTLLFATVYAICKGRRESPPRQNRNRNRAISNGREHSSITIDDSASFDPSVYVNQISMAAIAAATGNFSSNRIIGDGSFGFVYKACLPSGITIAVKKLSPDAFQGLREFKAEMDTLGRLRHPHIVKILGYCASGRDRVLIYEFIEKGSLDQWLYDTWSDDSRHEPLSWETRLKIVGGVANGLSYLHGLEKPIIHRDIKASNVLIDNEFEAHIADFGLARRIDASHSHVSTQVAGTMGYMPPEYKEGITGATVKADAYSFGVLMLEIATGRRPNWPVTVEGKEVGLVEWAKRMAAQNRVMEMIDSKASRDGLSEAEVGEYFRVSRLCTNEVFKERPAMDEVVELLNQIST